MGVEIKLTDKELPVSPVFVDFLAHIVDNRPFEGAGWHDQLSEELSNDHVRVMEKAQENAQRIMASEAGQRHVARA